MYTCFSLCSTRVFPIYDIEYGYPDASLIFSEGFNPRTKYLQEFIINDRIAHIIPDTNDYPSNDSKKIKGLLETKYVGQSLIELCCAHSIHILNGRVSAFFRWKLYKSMK